MLRNSEVQRLTFTEGKEHFGSACFAPSFSKAVGSSETLVETYKATQYHSQWDHSMDLRCSETSDISLYHIKFVQMELIIS